METKTMAINGGMITLYRCSRCRDISTWVSNQVAHRRWHRLRDEAGKRLSANTKAAAAGGKR